MTDTERLQVLKKNLQVMNTTNDVLLVHLLAQSGRRLGTMGVTDDGSGEYDDLLIDFAAYLYRSRARLEADSGMPRFLRKELNDMKIRQRAEVES